MTTTCSAGRKGPSVGARSERPEPFRIVAGQRLVESDAETPVPSLKGRGQERDRPTVTQSDQTNTPAALDGTTQPEATLTTPPPTDLDTLTDTVGSRIEITAGGKKYTGVLTAVFEDLDPELDRDDLEVLKEFGENAHVIMLNISDVQAAE